jgi:DNA-binding XRE family transcriptional regulator/molybdate-binding protein
MKMRGRREALGLSQAVLAERAGVSRQLVSAVESGRHEPGVGAAMSLARELGLSVEALFGPDEVAVPASPVTGSVVSPGPVRVGRVGDRHVVVAVPPLDQLEGLSPEGAWDGASVRFFEGARAAELVLVGCEPALGVLASIVEPAAAALWVKGSSMTAAVALAEGRAHVAVVHDTAGRLPAPGPGVSVFEVARWRVGVAFDRAAGSLGAVVAAGRPVAQREKGAATQAAFERWLRRRHLARPRPIKVGGHVEACRLVAGRGAAAAVTAEPAALAAGLGFTELEEHVVHLWCRTDLLSYRPVAAAMDVLVSAGFGHRLELMAGYDVSRCGTRVA